MKSEHLKEGQRVMVHMGSAIADIYGTPPFVTTATVLGQSEQEGFWWVNMDIPGPPGMTTLPQQYRDSEILGLSFLPADIPANNEIPGLTTEPVEPYTPYSRDVLVNTVIYHGRTDIKGCHCGWAELGKSHAEHVANVYEQSAREHA